MDLEWPVDMFEWVPDQIPLFIRWSESLARYTPAVCALLWLLTRGLQILKKPATELGDLLGLDVPPVPDVSLAGIRDTEVDLTWKQPEFQNSTDKHIVQVNGINVGETSRSETAITVYGLNPGYLYNIRVISVNSADFQSPSPLIRLETAPPRNHLSFRNSKQFHNDGHGKDAKEDDRYPGVRAQVPVVEPSTPTTAPAMVREPSGGLGNVKRSNTGRKHSPSIAQSGHSSRRESETDISNSDNGQSIQELTAKLESLQREIEDLDIQWMDEEKEHSQEMTDLGLQRDDLKQSLRDKEEASNRLKREVASLGSSNRVALNKKATTEKHLYQKELERQHKRDEIVHWREEAIKLQARTQELLEEKIKFEEETARRIQDMRNIVSENHATIKTLEEDIRVKGIQIKELEGQRRRFEPGSEEKVISRDELLEKQSDLQWENEVKELEARYILLQQRCQEARENRTMAQQTLVWWQQRRNSHPELFGSALPFEFDVSTMMNRARRNFSRRSRNNTISSQIVPFSAHDYSRSSGFENSLTSPVTSSNASIFGFNHSISIPAAPNRSTLESSFEDLPMSPTADSLLPSDLLAGDEDTSISRPRPSTAGSLSIERPSKLLPLGLQRPELFASTPQSPGSSNSPSSLFASPKVSSSNLPSQSQIMNSEESSENPHHMRRLSNLFGLNRARGKTVTLSEGLPFGSIKSGQSQSFPRNYGEPVQTEARRRRGSSGGWTNSVANLWNRSLPFGNDISKEHHESISHRRPFNMFSGNKSVHSSFGPIGSPIYKTSSRPGSTYSAERPRHSNENQSFGWPIDNPLTHHGSPLGTADWVIPAEPFSRSRSRRQSLQFGSSSSNNLPLGPPPLEMDGYKSPIMKPKILDPIGTRPKSSQRPITPKLNPKAPSFSFLKREKKADKTHENGVKIKDRLSRSDTEKTGFGHGIHANEDSNTIQPMHSEYSLEHSHSCDSQSIMTVPSIMSDGSEPLEHAASATPSWEVAVSSTYPSQKESFMQKLSRKTSSSKFNVPWSKSKKNSDGNVPSDGIEEGHDEYKPREEDLGKSVDSVVSSTHSLDRDKRSSITWSSILRRKGKDKENGETFEKLGLEEVSINKE